METAVQEPYRMCTKCGSWLPYSMFRKAAKRPAGIAGICKRCDNELYRESRNNNPSRLEQHRKSRISLRMDVLNAYSGGAPRCVCCGETTPGFLTIDHIDGGGTEHRRQIGSSLYSWLKKNDYPEGYRILCYNCNCAIGAYGRCPHVDPSAGNS